jgi:hypothetical protein
VAEKLWQEEQEGGTTRDALQETPLLAYGSFLTIMFSHTIPSLRRVLQLTLKTQDNRLPEGLGRVANKGVPIV